MPVVTKARSLGGEPVFGGPAGAAAARRVLLTPGRVPLTRRVGRGLPAPRRGLPPACLTDRKGLRVGDSATTVQFEGWPGAPAGLRLSVGRRRRRCLVNPEHSTLKPNPSGSTLKLFNFKFITRIDTSSQ